MSWSKARTTSISRFQASMSGMGGFLARRFCSSMMTSSTHQVNDAFFDSYILTTVTGVMPRPSIRSSR
jgi:hypothetical protein